MTHLEREAVRFTKERLDAGEITHDQFNQEAKETLAFWLTMKAEERRLKADTKETRK